MPPPFIMGGEHIASPLSVHPYIRTSCPVRTKNGFRVISGTQVYKHKIQVKFDYGQNPPIIIRVMALDLRMKNGFWAISFEYSDVLGSYFIHRYIIIKYRSSSIMSKIDQLLSELWPLILV